MKRICSFFCILVLILTIGNYCFAKTDEQLGNKAESYEKNKSNDSQKRQDNSKNNDDNRDRAETDRGRRANDPKGVEIDQSTWKTDGAKPR